jgi:hypothetical protein
MVQQTKRRRKAHLTSECAHPSDKMANKTTMKCFSQQQQQQQQEQSPVPVFTISRAVTLQRALLLSP